MSNIGSVISRFHTVSTLSYPTNLVRYDDLKDWVEGSLPGEDFIVVAESFSGPLVAMIGAGYFPHLKGIVFAATFVRKPRGLPLFFAHLLGFLSFNRDEFHPLKR